MKSNNCSNKFAKHLFCCTKYGLNNPEKNKTSKMNNVSKEQTQTITGTIGSYIQISNITPLKLKSIFSLLIFSIYDNHKKEQQKNIVENLKKEMAKKLTYRIIEFQNNDNYFMTRTKCNGGVQFGFIYYADGSSESKKYILNNIKVGGII
jgi:hypothetical protein